MKVKIKKLIHEATMPTYGTPGAACFDLYAATVNKYQAIGSIVQQGYPVECGTGLAFEIPQGWAMLVFSRSGHGFNHDTRLANCVGIIDSDYRGEVKVKLTCDDFRDDIAPLKVSPGDRVAQAMLVPIQKIEFVFGVEISSTDRGEGGFGSTGK